MRLTLMILLLALSGMVTATMNSTDLAEAKQLISSNVSCDKLNSSQLELIGDYYMEQMHPGQAHEVMDQMMGGEGSASLNAAHIQMAQVLYCGETNTTPTYGGMMGMMPFMFGSAGYGSGMMAYPYGGMMENYGNMMGYSDWWWVLGLLFWALVFVALVLLVYWLYRSIRGGGQAVSPGDILKQRYAKGEITKKQFDDIKKDIQ